MRYGRYRDLVLEILGRADYLALFICQYANLVLLTIGYAVTAGESISTIIILTGSKCPSEITDDIDKRADCEHHIPVSTPSTTHNAPASVVSLHWLSEVGQGTPSGGAQCALFVAGSSRSESWCPIHCSIAVGCSHNPGTALQLPARCCPELQVWACIFMFGGTQVRPECCQPFSFGGYLIKSGFCVTHQSHNGRHAARPRHQAVVFRCEPCRVPCLTLLSPKPLLLQ